MFHRRQEARDSTEWRTLNMSEIHGHALRDQIAHRFAIIRTLSQCPNFLKEWFPCPTAVLAFKLSSKPSKSAS